MSIADAMSTGESDADEIPAVDDSGSATFRRYRWQSKMAVLSWLSCLETNSELVAVVCEEIEDLILVFKTRRTFAQLKTRDRGSWSVSKICGEGGGIDSLARTHRTLGPSGEYDLQLWLEGPIGDTKETSQFFRDPTLAPEAVRQRIVGRGVARGKVYDFLSRLSILPDRPPRSYIDAVVLKYIGALWPALGALEQAALYEKLLACAERAQSGELEGATLDAEVQQSLGVENDEPQAELVGRKSLTRQMILDLVPPLPSTSRDDLLARIQRGEVASALELKMSAAGASLNTIETAQSLRALAEIRRLELLAASQDAEEQLTALELGLREMGDAQVEAATLLGGSNPSIAGRPAEFVASQLRSNPANLIALDGRDLFNRNASLIYGFLCHVSDECRFWWRSL